MTTFVLITGLILLAMFIGLLFNPKPTRIQRPAQTGGHNHPGKTYWEQRGGK